MIAYKCQFQPTVASSSTEAEFMAACDIGKMILFIRSILWDLNVPQEPRLFFTKIMMGAPPWVMHKSLLHASDTSTLSTSPFVNGLNAI
jgi:hypothetical protein